jgi:uncharacterized protein YidB (DUF937 family)
MGFWDIFKRPSKATEQAAQSAPAAGSAVTAGTATTTEAADTDQNVLEKMFGDEWKAVGKLFGDAGEKFSGIMEKLGAGGLDDKLKSWIGKGDNQEVTAEEVKAALGPEEVDNVAKEMGVSSDEAASKLAKLLPTVIDKLTPDGLVPDPDGLAAKLTGLFKK